MIFTVPQDHLKGRLESLKRFKTEQELEALLVSDTEPLSSIVKELTNVVPINEEEAGAFLLYLRSISIGENIEFLLTCDGCKTMNNPALPIDLCFDGTVYTFQGQDVPQGMFNSPDEIINTLEEVSILEYNNLHDILKKQKESILKLAHQLPCRGCGETLTVQIDPRDVFSKSTLSSIYQDYVNISMFSNNGKLDVDALYPFERELFQSLIEDKMDPQ